MLLSADAQCLPVVTNCNILQVATAGRHGCEARASCSAGQESFPWPQGEVREAVCCYYCTRVDCLQDCLEGGGGSESGKVTLSEREIVLF
jgi:hypothetical protein